MSSANLGVHVKSLLKEWFPVRANRRQCTGVLYPAIVKGARQGEGKERKKNKPKPGEDSLAFGTKSVELFADVTHLVLHRDKRTRSLYITPVGRVFQGVP